MKKIIIFTLLLYPLFQVGYGYIVDDLTANPVDYLIDTSGEWALGMLVLTLACTPLRKWFKHAEFSQYKKMFGLFTFFYATIHLLTYVGLDHNFNWSEIYKQITNVKYIVVGFIAWILLLPLAITSNKFSMKLLKGKWKVLHKLTYVVAVFSIVHYVWLSKTLNFEVISYVVVMAILLVSRVENFWWKYSTLIKILLIVSPMMYVINEGIKDKPNKPTTPAAVQAALDKHNALSHVYNKKYFVCYEEETNKGTEFKIKVNKCNKLWKLEKQ